jgi:hypothetical protein
MGEQGIPYSKALIVSTLRISLDATDLMTKVQRMRRFGTESHVLQVLDYLSEHSYPFDTKTLVPAFKHPVTGKLYIGRRGDTHNDIIDSHPDEIDPPHKDNPNPYDRGFYNQKDKSFINKADSGLDSADLMTKMQRMRKLGVESYDPERVMTNPSLNTLKGAMNRWRRAYGEPDARYIIHGNNVHVASAYHKTHEDIAKEIFGKGKYPTYKGGAIRDYDIERFKNTAELHDWAHKNYDYVNEQTSRIKYALDMSTATLA